MWSSEESIGMTRKSTDGLLTASLKQTLVSNNLAKNRGPAPQRLSNCQLLYSAPMSAQPDSFPSRGILSRGGNDTHSKKSNSKMAFNQLNT